MICCSWMETYNVRHQIFNSEVKCKIYFKYGIKTMKYDTFLFRTEHFTSLVSESNVRSVVMLKTFN